MTLKVEILGTGCKKCHQLEANAKEAIAHRQIEADIAHITNTMEIVKRGVMKTPALVVQARPMELARFIIAAVVIAISVIPLPLRLLA
jgi:hypothetical protein